MIADILFSFLIFKLPFKCEVFKNMLYQIKPRSYNDYIIIICVLQRGTSKYWGCQNNFNYLNTIEKMLS